MRHNRVTPHHIPSGADIRMARDRARPGTFRAHHTPRPHISVRNVTPIVMPHSDTLPIRAFGLHFDLAHHIGFHDRYSIRD
jgi:hypothetical protein